MWRAVLSFTVVCGALIVAGGGARGDNWPQWRGPRRDGVSAETGLLRSWPTGGPKLAWQATGLGTGYSSIVTGGGRIYTIGKQDADVVVTALDDVTRAAVWTRKIGATSRTPCSTPTLDGDRLFALDPDGVLVCLDTATGDIVWQRRFLEDFSGVMMSGRGYGESPLIDGDRLIGTPGGPDAALIALDKRTGAIIWKAKLPEIGPIGREGAGFSSIVVTEAAGVRQYVQLVGRGVVGIAARDGRFLWGFNAIANQTANIPTPIVAGDLVFSANGYTAGSALLKLVPDRDAGSTTGVKAETVYSLTAAQFQNHHGGVVRIGNYVYGGHGNNNGMPTCLELATGRIVWKRRGPGVGSAAVTAADGMLYFRYQNGVVALIEASEHGYYLRGTLEIPGAGGDSWAHPVVAKGRLYLREQDTLLVYDIRREPGGTDAFPIETATALVHPAVVALRKSNVSVERLPPAATGRSGSASSPRDSSAHPSKRQPEKGHPLYEFVVDPNPQEPTETPLVVTLTDEQLNADGTITEAVFKPLKDLPGSLVVSLAGTRVSDAGLAALHPLPNVAGLNLELCRDITDAGLEHLASLESLRVLILTGTAVTHVGVRHLRASSGLVALDLEACDGINDAACEALAGFPSLRALNLKKTGFEPKRVTNAGLEHLAALANLELLNLYGNAVTDEGLAHFARLDKLRDLDLSLLPLTDAGLRHLQALKRLERLELLYGEGFAGPTLTDAACKSLKDSTTLRILNLTGAKLTDRGLERLAGLKNLAFLRLVRTSVSASGVERFQAVHPDCEIVR